MAGRLLGQGSTYKVKTGRHAGRWRAELVVGWRPDGQKVTRSRLRNTKDEAKEALRELLNERDRTGVINHQTSGTDWRMREWTAHWIGQHTQESGIEPNTAEGYRSLLRNWIGPVIGNVAVHRVTPAHVKKVISAMRDLSGSRRRQCYTVMHAALEHAAAERLIARNPADDVDAPVAKRRPVQVPDRRDVEAIYAAAKDDPMRARWLVALMLGLRQGEALGLEWRDINYRSMTVTVRQQLHRERGHHGCSDPKRVAGKLVYACGWSHAKKCPAGTPGKLIIKTPKTDRGSRTVPLLPVLVPLLKTLERQQEKDRKMDSAYALWRIPTTGDRTRPADLVFRQPYGGPIEPRADYRAWMDLLARAGVTATKLHAARHAAAVNMLDAGVAIAHLSELLGHASEAFTWGTYGSFSKEASDSAREKMNTHQAALMGDDDAQEADVVPIGGRD